MKRTRWIAAAVVATLCSWATDAVGAPGPPTRPQPRPPATRPPPKVTGQPWAKGVTAAAKSKALKLYQEGNKYFESSQYAKAIKEYRRAIKHWDHPGIRFNMAKCLMNLNRPLEAYHSLKAALRFGAAPLEPPRLYQEGKLYLKLLQGRLSRARISCRQKGVRVTLDGQLLFVGPGAKTLLLDPAQKHVVVAEKPKYLTVTKTLVLTSGRLATLRLKLLPFKKTYAMKRYWPTWIPWTVLGAGIAVAALGVIPIMKAISQFEDYDREFDRWCQDPQGCSLSARPAWLSDMDKKAQLSRGFGIGLFVLGGAALVTSVTLIIVNLPRAVEIKPKKKLSILPTPLPGGGMVNAQFRF